MGRRGARPAADGAARSARRGSAGPGTVAAYRELTGHDDDATALGPPPKPGQVEAYAAWRAAWRALGRPEADRDELEMSDGQLRVRVRAYEREKAWAPRYVANELAGTRQAADNHRQTAALRTAEAETATGRRAGRLEREAAEAAALAETLDERAAQLEVDDDARTQLAAPHRRDPRRRPTGHRPRFDRAARGRRGAGAGGDRRGVARAARRGDARRGPAPGDHRRSPTSTSTSRADERRRPVEDIRDVAAAEPAPVDEDVVRVPSADEMAESVRRAQRALAEIRAREAADAEREVDESRVDQLARWHEDDQADGRGLDDVAELEDAPW